MTDSTNAPELSDVARRVLHIAGLIPPGNVSTYGEVGKAADATARQVGAIMRQWGSQVSWWRVIKSDGTSHDFDRAKSHWEEEGIQLRGKKVRMDICGLDHRDLLNLDKEQET
ncbi:MGMT family protein [Corynebacterium sp. L4756]|uniref:MGMT family protein n=1 Tax=unclassified Corynebacterium TaxID=2624378 RepID=UPI00374D5FC7